MCLQQKKSSACVPGGASSGAIWLNQDWYTLRKLVNNVTFAILWFHKSCHCSCSVLVVILLQRQMEVCLHSLFNYPPCTDILKMTKVVEMQWHRLGKSLTRTRYHLSARPCFQPCYIPGLVQLCDTSMQLSSWIKLTLPGIFGESSCTHVTSQQKSL